MKASALHEDSRRQMSTMHLTLLEQPDAFPTNWQEHSSTNLQTTLSILINDVLLAWHQLQNQKPLQITQPRETSRCFNPVIFLRCHEEGKWQQMMRFSTMTRVLEATQWATVSLKGKREQTTWEGTGLTVSHQPSWTSQESKMSETQMERVFRDQPNTSA